VIKNTLLVKAMELLVMIMVSCHRFWLVIALYYFRDCNGPGKIKDFRKKSTKPLLKGAYINAEIYIGDDQLDALATIKSREELGELLAYFRHQHRVISALQNQFAERGWSWDRSII
jgi:large subunit ribosomal protein L10